MNQYRFKATNLIAEAFEDRGIFFDVVNYRENEELMTYFSINCGPTIIVKFISHSDENDVAVRIFNLISKIPEERRSRVIEACNILNKEIRYMKFYPNSKWGINVEYDFPVYTPDDSVGQIAFEMLIRMNRILNSEYDIFMKAIYSDEALDKKYISPEEMVAKLKMLRKMLADKEGSVNDEDIEDDYEDDYEDEYDDIN